MSDLKASGFSKQIILDNPRSGGLDNSGSGGAKFL